MKNVCSELKALRKSRRRTQQWLAKKTGLSKNYISKIEREKATPSMEVINKICETLNGEPVFYIKNKTE